MFVDEATLFARGGDGGAGAAAFKRARGKPRGKAVGGDGGRGGDVVVRADPSVASLIDIKRRPHRRAGSGKHGEGDARHGESGEDLIVPVPMGTLVYEESVLLADLVKEGQSVVVAAGGRSGRGNASLAGLKWRSPGFAEQGEYGQEATISLEIKLIADAALVGFPNAGKSTLISTVSAARPKVADYPFTTLQPHLGVVDVDGTDFVLADIPGLVEGAAEGKGLGHEFLRHTERARVLVMLLDPSTLQTAGIEDQYRVLSREIGAFSSRLASRPRLVAVAKSDLVSEDESTRWHRWARSEGFDLHLISSVTGEGVTALMKAVLQVVQSTQRESPDRLGYILHRPAGPGFRLEHRDDVWILSGLAAERAVNLNDLSSPDAIAFVADRLRRTGIAAALENAGVEPGDEVRIGKLVFEFQPERADA